MKVLGVSRRALFEQIDRPALTPLPRTRYELGEWIVCRPNIDYHVTVDHNFYSVPYQFAGEALEARVTASTVEVFFKSRRVAAFTIAGTGVHLGRNTQSSQQRIRGRLSSIESSRPRVLTRVNHYH